MRPVTILIVTLFLLNGQATLAQTMDAPNIKDSLTVGERSHFIIGATYNSTMNYYGRVDSLKSSGIYPFVGFSLKNGLYGNATFVFIRNALQSQYAATLLEGGYNYTGKNGHWAGNLSASRYFYQENIDLVQSAVKENLSASLSYLNKVININLGADIKFSNKADPGIQAGLDHIIRIPHVFGDDVLVLDPSAWLYAGTQNFSRTWYEKKNLLLLPIGEEQVTENSRKFNVLAYEISMPLVYAYKKFNLILSPAYILPQHILSVPGQPALSENAAELFYFTATLKFTL